MAPYQKPTVEEIEDEARRIKENGIWIHVVGLGNLTHATATATATSAASASALVTEAKRLRKRKCPWDSTQRMGKIPNGLSVTG